MTWPISRLVLAFSFGAVGLSLGLAGWRLWDGTLIWVGFGACCVGFVFARLPNRFG